MNRRVSHGTGFWFVAVAFAVLMGFGTAPTPLWPLYAQRDHFDSTTVTLAFALLVLGAAAGFLALGHLSDHLGRRRVIVPSLVVAIAAALVLTVWASLPGLLLGRFLNGVGIGLMASTATTYLRDLDRAHSPAADVVATAANLGGLAGGPLLAGLVAEYLPNPLLVTQLGFALALTVCLLLVLLTPETVDRRVGVPRPRRVALRAGTGPLFAGAAALGFVSFALMGLIGSLGAIILRDQLHIADPFVAGLASFLLFAAGAAGQLGLRAATPSAMLRTGVPLFVGGLALVAVAVRFPVLWLFLLAVAVAGAGAGIIFRCGVSLTATVARPESRAGTLSLYFVLSYVGMGLPSVLFSLGSTNFGLQPTMVAFVVLLSSGAALSALRVRQSDHAVAANPV